MPAARREREILRTVLGLCPGLHIPVVVQVITWAVRGFRLLRRRHGGSDASGGRGLRLRCFGRRRGRCRGHGGCRRCAWRGFRHRSHGGLGWGWKRGSRRQHNCGFGHGYRMRRVALPAENRQRHSEAGSGQHRGNHSGRGHQAIRKWIQPMMLGVHHDALLAARPGRHPDRAMSTAQGAGCWISSIWLPAGSVATPSVSLPKAMGLPILPPAPLIA